MRHEKISLCVSGSKPETALYTYLLDDSPELKWKERPMIIVCPGGAYINLSDREAEPIALALCAMGYHAAVLRYSTAPSRFPTALLEVGAAVSYIRSHAEQWNVNPEKIAVMGFSAAGHLACSYGCFWSKDWVSEALHTPKEQLRPNGMILCYPVISSGEFAHHPSIHNLLGEAYDEKKELVSLEKQISSDVPDTFLWHTMTDDVVPVQNSLFLVNALAAAGISTEFHLYPRGYHGLALATPVTQPANTSAAYPEVASWIDLLHTWLEHWRVK